MTRFVSLALADLECGVNRETQRGVASTLFVRRQRTELFQLERAPGIRIESVSMNGDSFDSIRERAPVDLAWSA